jgi:hypothetical protein
MYALAQWARRSGDLAAADARFDALLARDGADPVVLANAANVKIALGDPKAAVGLYRRAIASEPSALLWFNLSQAHGRAIDVEQHARALAAAQSLDADAVSELTARLAGSHGAAVADVALPQRWLRKRLAAHDASLAAEQLRRALAPGVLGRSVWLAALAFAAAGALGVALRGRLEASTTCLECGTRLCRHCGTARDALRQGAVAEPRCASCVARRIESRAGAGWESRTSGAHARLTRGTNALGWLFPGLVGRSARRPALGLGAALCAAGAGVRPGRGFGRARSGQRRRRWRARLRRPDGVAPRSTWRSPAWLLASTAGVAHDDRAARKLRDFGMGEVFQLIGQQRKTGVLEVRGEKGEVTLRFDTGGVVSASPVGASADEALIEMTVRCGLVPRDRLAAAASGADASLPSARTSSRPAC